MQGFSFRVCRVPGSGWSSQSARGRCTMGLREGGTSQGGRRTPLGPAVHPIKRDSPAHVPAGTSVGRSRVNALRQDWPQAAPPAVRSKSWPDRSMACITTASFRATVTAFSAEVRVRPNSARSGHSLGNTFFNNGFRCALTRLKRPDEALGELRRAAELAPDRARYAYVYAVGLHSSGRGGEAMTVLQDGLVRHPGDRDTLLA